MELGFQKDKVLVQAIKGFAMINSCPCFSRSQLNGSDNALFSSLALSWNFSQFDLQSHPTQFVILSPANNAFTLPQAFQIEQLNNEWILDKYCYRQTL